jgi:hypothetical protein
MAVGRLHIRLEGRPLQLIGRGSHVDLAVPHWRDVWFVRRYFARNSGLRRNAKRLTGLQFRVRVGRWLVLPV